MVEEVTGKDLKFDLQPDIPSTHWEQPMGKWRRLLRQTRSGISCSVGNKLRTYLFFCCPSLLSRINMTPFASPAEVSARPTQPTPRHRSPNWPNSPRCLRVQTPHMTSGGGNIIRAYSFHLEWKPNLRLSKNRGNCFPCLLQNTLYSPIALGTAALCEESLMALVWPPCYNSPTVQEEG